MASGGSRTRMSGVREMPLRAAHRTVSILSHEFIMAAQLFMRCGRGNRFRRLSRPFSSIKTDPSDCLRVPRVLIGGDSPPKADLLLDGNISKTGRHFASLLSAHQACTSNVLQALPSRQACSCAATAEFMKPTVAPQPGTVTPYTHHVMIRLPQPAGHASADKSIWWPPVIEKHPALVQAFSAVADCKNWTLGTVKVTAYEHMEVADQSGDQSRVDMLIFPAGVYFSRVPLDKIHEIVTYHLKHCPEGKERPQLPSLGKKSSRGDFKGIGVFICTHMSRDTRCGRLGYQLAKRLQELVDERGYDKVLIYQASHIGGHKFAGNVLVYGGISPCDGDWFGGLTQHNAEKFLDRLVNMEVESEGGVADEYLRQFWRGRMMLSKEEQLAVFENPEGLQDEDFDMSGDTSSSSSSSSSSSDEGAK